MTPTEGELRIKPVQVMAGSQGAAWLKDLYELFALVRDEAAKYSERDTSDDIDQALKDVCRKDGPRRRGRRVTAPS